MPRQVGFIGELPTDRFWRNVIVQSNGCWIWVGPKDKHGYGIFYSEGRNQRAHKWLYERCFGRVPVGLELGHVPLPNASKDCCPLGHPYTPENTYFDPDGNRKCRECRRVRDAEYRRKNRVGNPEYIAKQRQYRREQYEKYNAARRAKYRAENPERERQKFCHAGHSLEDPKNVYFARGRRHCRECRKRAQQRYVEQKNGWY